MRRNQILFCVLMVLILLLPNATALAAALPDTPAPTNYCFPVEVQDRCLGATEVITAVLGEWALNVAVGAAKTVDGLIWLLDRAAAFLFDTMVNSTWLISIKDQLLTALTSLMPNVLQQVVMGSSGLMYIALALSGILMIVPLIDSDQARLVRPERVILWGCLLIALFMGGSSMGYDLVNMVEDLRLSVMQNIMGTVESPATKLIQSPMSASSREFDDQNLLQLPSSYENLYFPDPQTVEVTVKFFPQIGPQNTFIETKDSAQSRASLAGTSLFFAFISLVGAYTLLLFSITFAFLGVAALVLILFLFAALPLGFFEFGNLILKNIIEKYMQIVFFSIGMAVFVRWVVTWISSFPDASDVQSALTWASLLLVVVAVLHVILNGSFRVLIASAQVFSGSVQAVFGGGSLAGGLGTILPGNLSTQLQQQVSTHSENKPEVVTSIVQGALSAVGFHAVGSLLQPTPSQERQRGDVFQDQPEGAKDSGKQSTQSVVQETQGQAPQSPRPFPSSAQPQEKQPPAPALASQPDSLTPTSVWQDETTTPSQAFAAQPQVVFQPLGDIATPISSTDEAVQQALRTGQTMTPDKLIEE